MRSLAAVLLTALSVAHAADDAVVVTATRFPERRLDASVGMTVISADDIARDSARTLPELLSHLGGLYVRNNSGDPNLQLDLRGFGITGDQNTLVLLDGIRLNENDLSTTKLSAIPLQSIARIEILRGSGAVLYGGGASGGTINIVTKSPQLAATQASAYAGAGSYGTAEARASGNLAGKEFGTLVSGSHYESDNYRVNNRVRQDNAAADVRYVSVNDTLGVKFGSDSQRLQLPGTRDQNQMISDPRGTSTPSDWATRTGDYLTVLGRHTAGNLELAADFSYRDQLAKSNFASFASYSEARLHTTTFAPRLSWRGQMRDIGSNLVVGADFNDWGYGRNIATDPSTILAPFSTTSATQQSSALYAQYNAQFPAGIKFSLGWRTQRVFNRLVQAGFAASDQQQMRSPHAGEAGLQYSLTNALTLYGRLGTSFRIATIDENAFTSTGNLLEPQTARHADAGIEYRTKGLQLRAGAYRLDLQNEIYFSPLVVPFGANTNLSPTDRSGLEFSAQLPVAESLTVTGNLNLQAAKFRSGMYGGIDVSGKDVPLVPRAIANAQAAWRATPETEALAALRLVGHQRYDNDQANAFAQEMPAYALMDLKLVQRVSDWRLTAGVNNLFNKAYYSYGIVNSFACATAICAYPEARRSIFVSAELPLH